MQVLDFADLYAGKLAAALSRQHPRDLFDVSLLLEDERADGTLWRTFLVYLTCSPKPAWEMLAPREPADFEATFNTHFRGMTSEPVSVEQLLQSRARLLERVAAWLDEPPPVVPAFGRGRAAGLRVDRPASCSGPAGRTAQAAQYVRR
ncbi:nucleotidyl transferase AbiEii/AbiGii toxin family protein [Cupriavidus sp. CP313]